MVCEVTSETKDEEVLAAASMATSDGYSPMLSKSVSVFHWL
jgi:hypothetical protein